MSLILLSLAIALSARPSVAIVSYRVAAPPHSIIRYAGEEYRTSASGSIELAAEPASPTISIGDSVFNLPQSGPTDDFGSVTVSLVPQSEGYKSGLQPRGAKTRAAR